MVGTFVILNYMLCSDLTSWSNPARREHARTPTVHSKRTRGDLRDGNRMCILQCSTGPTGSRLGPHYCIIVSVHDPQTNSQVGARGGRSLNPDWLDPMSNWDASS